MNQLQSKILSTVLLTLSLLFVLSVPVLAQDFETEELSPRSETEEARSRADEKSQSAAGKERKLKIQFDDELVKGQQSMPEAEFIFTRAQFNYKKMIRLRENFIPEVQKGKDEFRGKR